MLILNLYICRLHVNKTSKAHSNDLWFRTVRWRRSHGSYNIWTSGNIFGIHHVQLHNNGDAHKLGTFNFSRPWHETWLRRSLTFDRVTTTAVCQCAYIATIINDWNKRKIFKQLFRLKLKTYQKKFIVFFTLCFLNILLYRCRFTGTILA